MTVDIVPVASLTLDPANARKHPDRNLEAIKGSLLRFGQQRPLVVDKKGVVRAGNGTLTAARQLNWDTIAVVRSELPPSELTAFGIADNRTAELAEWDNEVLSSLLADVDLGDVGFTLDEIQAIDAGGTETPPIVEDEAPEASTVPARCSKGDLWQLGDHYLLCGDCRNAGDVARLVGQAKINLAVTSPPYASQRKYDESSGFKPIPPDEYVAWWDDVQASVRKHLAPDGSFFVNIKPHCDDGQRSLYVADMVLAMVRKWAWRFVDEFCWKRTGPPGSWPNRFKNSWEPVYHFSGTDSIKFRPSSVGEVKDSAYKGNGGTTMLADKGAEHVGESFVGLVLPSNVIECSGVESGTGHTAAYPVGLPSFFIKAFTDAGDTVYEPFCGSGTTLIAAEQLGRRCFGIEISPHYCDVILARWERFTGLSAVKL